MRLLATLLAASTLCSSSACYSVNGKKMDRSSRRGLIVGGTLATISGAVVASMGTFPVDSNGDGYNTDPLNDDWTGAFIGMAVAAAGLTMLSAAFTADVQDSPTETSMMAATATRTSTGITASRITSPRHSAAVPSPAVRSAPLPELPVDAETLRLAQQTRVVIAAGHCDAARPLLDGIAARSPRYHVALVRSTIVEPCPQLRMP